MAVPPKGGKIIFESILKSFAGIKYKSMPSNIKPMLHKQPCHKFEKTTAEQLAVFEKRRYGYANR
jgi:hypothetical protein